MSRKAQRYASRRSVKEDFSEHREIKPKYLEERKAVPPLIAMNAKQQYYIDLIESKNCVIATGLAGTSKTYIPTVIACDMLRTGLIEKIVLVRPAVSNSASVGFFGGSVVEKMSLWLMPILSTLHKRMGKSVVDEYIKDGCIVCVPLETIKGQSFGKDTFVIGDEIEDVEIEEIKSILTRQGGGKMVLCGDIEQSALSQHSGLLFAKQMTERHPQLLNSVGFVDFNSYDDIVRSDECKDWVKAFHKERV